MAKRKSVDTPARKRRRLPHVAVIERSDPFLPADTDTLYEQCRRITNGQEFHHGRRWQHDRDVHVIHFAEAHQAKALEEWVRRNRFYDRPKPHYGPSQAERSAFEQEAGQTYTRETRPTEEMSYTLDWSHDVRFLGNEPYHSVTPLQPGPRNPWPWREAPEDLNEFLRRLALEAHS